MPLDKDVQSSSLLTLCASAILALAACLPLLPGLHGPFLLDDYANLVYADTFNPATWSLRAFLAAVFGNDSGPTGRPVAMATFAINAYYTGLDPFPMKLTNVLIHGVNAVLVCALLKRVFELAYPAGDQRRQMFWAIAVALAWATNPVAVTSTLYTVQRMNALYALFALLALNCYLAGRSSRTSGRFALFMLLTLITGTLGPLSKENGALLAGYILLLEVTILRNSGSRGWRLGVRLAGTILVLAGFTAVLLELPSILSGYDLRPFTLTERLLTEPRVVLLYAGSLFLPSLGGIGLFLDDIPLSRGLWEPATTLPSVLALILLLAAAIRLRKRAPLASFGIGLFLLGHMLESTIIPLEIAFEHRNYFPSIGIFIVVFDVLFRLERRYRHAKSWISAVAGVLILMNGLWTLERATAWSTLEGFSRYEYQRHPESVRATISVANGFAALLETHGSRLSNELRAETISNAIEFYERASDLTACDPTPLLILRRFSAEHELDFSEENETALLAQLEACPPARIAPALLDFLVQCTARNCKLQPTQLWTTISSALGNPLYRGEIRSELLLVAAKFALTIAGDPEMAIYYAASAVEHFSTGLRPRMVLIELLIGARRWSDADQEIIGAKKLIRADFGAYNQKILRYEETVNACLDELAGTGSSQQAAESHCPSR